MSLCDLYDNELWARYCDYATGKLGVVKSLGASNSIVTELFHKIYPLGNWNLKVGCKIVCTNVPIHVRMHVSTAEGEKLKRPVEGKKSENNPFFR